MKLNNYFKSFLDKEVNLNPDRIKRLDERTETITNLLRESDMFKDNFIDVIPQGSYAHKTIIKPVRDTDEFDADILLYIEEFPNWEANDYVENVYQVFRNTATYRDMVSRKTRCVTINYANDFHIDIVPFLERHGNKYVTNRHENNYELTNPEAFTEWLDEKNRITSHNYIKVVRLLKYLRDYKRTFSIKSIVLNTLLGAQVNDAALLEDSNCYQDISTTLYTIMKKMKVYVHDNYYMPVIPDPANTGENFGDRWNQEGWSNFRNWMIHYSDKITDAYEELDEEKSVKKWQIIFGEEFKNPNTSKVAITVNTSNVIQYNNTEQQITDLGYVRSINPRYTVRLKGRVLKKQGFRDYSLNKSGNVVGRNRSIMFTVENCNVPIPYTIFWKILNRGEEALTRNCIRGQIKEGTSTHIEPTLFRGNHYVECYIIKDNICVATDRQSVNIS